MITLYRQDGEILYGVKDYVLDTEEDVKKLPKDKDIRVGSSAFVITTGNRYFLNSSREWIKTARGGSADGPDVSEVLGQYDKDGNGIIDFAESASSIEIMSF